MTSYRYSPTRLLWTLSLLAVTLAACDPATALPAPTETATSSPVPTETPTAPLIPLSLIHI